MSRKLIDMSATGHARALAAATIAAAAIAWPAAAGAQSTVTGGVASVSKTQYALSTDAWFGVAALWQIPDPRGGAVDYKVVLAIPGGEIDGTGPRWSTEGDLRKPWASITENVSLASDSTVRTHPAGPRGTNVCNGFTNPGAHGKVGPAADGSVGIWAEVQCDDGYYDRYRLIWSKRQGEGVFLDPANQVQHRQYYDNGWGAHTDDNTGYTGGITALAPWYQSDDARFILCRRDGDWECFVQTSWTREVSGMSLFYTDAEMKAEVRLGESHPAVDSGD